MYNKKEEYIYIFPYFDFKIMIILESRSCRGKSPKKVRENNVKVKEYEEFECWPP